MMPKHAGTGKPHDLPDLLPHIRLVTVNRALGAGSLLRTERTSIQSLKSIAAKSLALFAQLAPRVMLRPAPQGNHQPDGFLFPGNAGRFLGVAQTRSPFQVSEIGQPPERPGGRSQAACFPAGPRDQLHRIPVSFCLY
jgi:hypothetical protein